SRTPASMSIKLSGRLIPRSPVKTWKNGTEEQADDQAQKGLRPTGKERRCENPRGPDLSARPCESFGANRPVVEGSRAEHRITEVVRARPGKIGRISRTLLPGAGEKSPSRHRIRAADREQTGD